MNEAGDVARRRRRWFWLAAAIAFLLVLGASLAAGLLATGWPLERVAAAVRDATGRELRVSGGIRVGLFPPRFVARDIALSNVAGASTADMLTASRIEAATTMAALLRGDWGLDLTLVAPKLSLETDRHGRPNWRLTRGAQGGPQDGDAPGRGRPAAQLPLAPRRLRIERARVEYRDGMSGRRHVLEIDEALLEPADGAHTALRLNATYDGRPFALQALAGTSLQALAAGRRELPIEFDAVIDGRRLGGEVQLDLRGEQPQAVGALASPRMVLHGALELSALRASLALADGRLQLAPIQAQLADGALNGSASLELRGRKPAVASLQLEGHGIDLGRLAAALGRPDMLIGGVTEMRLELHAQGARPAELLAELNGHLRLVAGPAQLRRRALDRAGDLLAELIEALEPGATRGAFTRIRCAVVNAPIRSGIVQVQRNVAAETERVGVLLVGTVDLVRQRLDLAMHPRVLQGAEVGIGQLVGLLRLEGPFDAPRLAIDSRGAAGLALELGAGIASGGLSVLGKRLLQQAIGAVAPCQQALEAHR